MKNDKVPEEFKRNAAQQVLSNERMADVLKGNPRFMFDFFDGVDLYIQITGTNNYGWKWGVNDSVDNPICSSRKEAEIKAIEYCLEALNNKLDIQVSQEPQLSDHEG